ncbi:MAG TPA: DUF1223 domain-containing protein [Steroidobacteraceae bacterium]|jgi:hypothetical protein
MSFNPSIAGLLSMGHNLRCVLLASSLSVGFVAAAGAETRPVVLELFTSEGCSSCPPAEVIVNELAQRPNVLPLSFHVDYWDDLGWRDRYSLASATKRQRVYARTLRRSSVYTPQAVIDGSRDIVGSQRAAVMAAVSGRRDGVAASVSVSGGTIQIHVGAGSDAATADVLLVGYLREATTPIGRGENSGRTLKESNIVLWLHELGRWNGKPREFEMSVSRLPENVTDIAVLVQSADQGAILGAVAQPIR